ncbi:MAG: glutamate racemase [Bacteroidales bacterium]|nr:glutamate racemase [Bacteroidales bacterium]MCF8389711.1 glutamate racemase [Bacteroidales bacterium]
MNKTQAPIGLFDSGVGGLTVAAAIKQVLPNESMIYFGDTAHLPYGDKSKETIVQYSLNIAQFLLNKGCKIILIACNSASANAFEEVRTFVGERAVVLNVIDPVVEYVGNEPSLKNIGVIGTKATINSGSYSNGIQSLRPDVNVSSLATPLFVPMIEEGFIFDDISNGIIRSYLSRPELKEVDSLILACTHYPIIMNQIHRFFNFRVNIIDSAQIVAERLKFILSEKQLLNTSAKASHQFFVSDHTDYFEIIAKMFFGEKIVLQRTSI